MAHTTIDSLIVLLQNVRSKIFDDSKTGWSNLESPQQLRKIIDEQIKGLSTNGLHSLDELEFLFAPTGYLQEFSIANNWGQEFLEISESFDILHEQIKAIR